MEKSPNYGYTLAAYINSRKPTVSRILSAYLSKPKSLGSINIIRSNHFENEISF